jgi:predicted nucleotidyltransferase
MSDFREASRETVQKPQASSLADELVQELVQELDHPHVVGITLGGSYARGTATEYSDYNNADL